MTKNHKITDDKPRLRLSQRVILPSGALAEKLLGSGYGTSTKAGLSLSLIEAVYLNETGNIVLVDGKNKALTHEKIEKEAKKHDARFFVRSHTYSDLRKRGYLVKTGLKYGADFRVYDKGMTAGDDHSKWIVYPVHERENFGWHDFAAKNRIAHGTHKRLVLGIVDDEGDVIYYEVRWLRP